MESESLNLTETIITRPRPVVLLMLDGWGVSPTRENNAIRIANIPVFKDLVAHYPATVLQGSPKPDSWTYSVVGSGQLKPKKLTSLAKIISQANLKQLKIAETEKFALVTNFFNNSDTPYAGEEQLIISSLPVVDEQNLDIKMATPEVVKKLLRAIKSDRYDFILTSLANIDNISHSGNFTATVKAIEYIDKVLGQIVKTVLGRQGILIIASSHGYAEEVFDIQTNLVNKNNTDNPVPFLIIGEQFLGKTIGLSEAPDNDLSLLKPAGRLVDILPTILQILNLPIPSDINGQSLV